MVLAPFRVFLTLIIFNGDFYLPQHLSADPAYRCTKLGGGCRGVKVEDGKEIFMLEAVFRFKTAP